MQTRINSRLSGRQEVHIADAILRSCVHCGFCLATCPTYKLLGDERESPRGRIYLIKEMLEQDSYPMSTVTHLDRCLTCGSCETTCPSGVQYGKLLDIGRQLADSGTDRSIPERFSRWILRQLLPESRIFSLLLSLGRLYKPILPKFLQNKIPDAAGDLDWPEQKHSRKMLALQGCVQSSAAPATNAALAKLLDKLGVSLVFDDGAGCCGSMEYHLSDQAAGANRMRALIDCWWPYVESGIEQIVITASGCGAMIKEYGEILKDDPVYCDKAETIANLCVDVAEVLSVELKDWTAIATDEKVAWHPPCTLQHRQKINGVVEPLLERSGVKLARVTDSHLCCGSAGTYSILQNNIASRLLEQKIDSLMQDAPDLIVTANIGCQLHLQSATNVPVKHWLELVADKYDGSRGRLD